MRKFKYMPHTADMSFIAYGKTFKEAIENAALALLSIMVDTKRISKVNDKIKRIKIRETAKTYEELVWFTLQDILSQREIHSLGAYKFLITKLDTKSSRYKLEGYILGKTLKEEYMLTDVKAVTPYDLYVKKGKVYSIRIVVDV